MSITEHDLESIRDRSTLYAFLRNKLAWPVDPDDTFAYDGPRLSGEIADRATVSHIVPFSANDPFAIFLVEFESQFRRGDLREVLRKIREQIRTRAKYAGRALEELIFVCATEAYGGVRFAHFETRVSGTPRLRVFGFDSDRADMTRTLRDENLQKLEMPVGNLLGEPDWAVCRERWLTAWNVEAVTDAFFRKYKEIFDTVQNKHIHGVVGDARMFTQRLFNRLMFVHFLSKKPEGWLKFNGRRDYLTALWEGRDRSSSFYSAHLCPLFFTALNNPKVKSLEKDNPSLYVRIGTVPYLNGGLFQRADDDTKGETIDDAAFKLIIEELFNRWNFTVHESTPDDIEVAVDPEMLGKVFEELVTGRHESGSYYTPRGIVQFMCRESLKGFLDGHASLVDEHDASEISVPQAKDLLAKLADIKVVDPACGSGAYLLGMLQELHALNRLLDTRAEQTSARDDYARKLAIIRNNIYGVDIDPFAVEIARLRLWLSLIVEYDGPTPEPLPNLDYKVECGDSLLAPAPRSEGTPDMFRADLIEEFSRKKSQHDDPYFTGDKAALRREIDEKIKPEIAKLVHHGTAVAGFDWRVEFAEVFQRPRPTADIGGAFNFGMTLAERPCDGGFDVVLANPPYVEQRLIGHLKPSLKVVYPDVYSGTADLYCYFYARALSLLRPGGMLAMISSNKWLRTAYGKSLRSHMAGGAAIRSITDFGHLPVFRSAISYPVIIVAMKGDRQGALTLTLPLSLEPPYPDVLALTRTIGQILPAATICDCDWSLATTDAGSPTAALRAGAGVPLREYCRARVYRGVTTGFNSAFVINEATREKLVGQDPRSADIIRPFAAGRDIVRWRVPRSRSWIIFARRGIDIELYPAVLRHLGRWRRRLEPKPPEWDPSKDGSWPGRKAGHYKWYEIQDETAYYRVFEQPKLVSTKMSARPTFSYAEGPCYLANTAYVIPTGESPRFLLGVLNSSAFMSYCRAVFVGKQNGWFEIQPTGLEAFPVPRAAAHDVESIERLVDACLNAAGGIGCEEWEAEIDERVAALYGV